MGVEFVLRKGGRFCTFKTLIGERSCAYIDGRKATNYT